MDKQISRLIGGILLVAGTTMGAGMLALPVITVFSGFFPSIILFIAIWLIMLATAFLFLEVNLSFRGEHNLVSMSDKTLGRSGRGATWFFYLLLLYALTAAYIAGCTPLIVDGFTYFFGWTPPDRLAPLLLPLVFGSFILLGTKGVDWANRILMIGFGVSYGALILFTPKEMDFELIAHSDYRASLISIPIILTSFGYHIIIPSLSTYMHYNRRLLRMTIVIGSLIPLAVYLVWQLMILGVVPFDGLVRAYQRGVPATEALAEWTNVREISLIAQSFSFFAITTSFIGVGLGLSDFLRDGFKFQFKPVWINRLIAIVLTLVPPLFFVLTYQRGFILALQHGGALVAILLIILPALMAWRLKKPLFQTVAMRTLLTLLIAVGLFVVCIDFVDSKGWLNFTISQYLNRPNV